VSVLRAIETKLENLFEGVFGRAFRTNVQPVELARKLAKEMDDHRTVSISRVYVPNEYTLYLSPDDRAQFEPYEASLIGELEEYLGEHARREGYELLSEPRVAMETDADLDVGEFGIATRIVQPERDARAAADLPPQVAPGATMVYRPKTPVAEAPPEEVEREVGMRVGLAGDRRLARADERAVGADRGDAGADGDAQLAVPAAPDDRERHRAR
jgi:hypothetical protein